MQIEWVRFDRERYNPHALAAVRQGAREGTLLDVATDQIFIALLLRNLQQSLTVDESEQGLRLEFRPTSRFCDKPIRQPEHIRTIETEQPRSTALVDNDYVVKIYRTLQAGINPEIEMGRFLTDVADFANTPALLGSVELVEGNEKSAIGVVHAFVANQGDAWTVTAAYLDRFVEEQRLLAASDARRRARGRDPLSALHVAGRAARRRAACRARRQQRASRIRAGADRPRRRAALDRRSDALRRARLRCAAAAARYAEGGRPAAGRSGAGVAAGACRIC